MPTEGTNQIDMYSKKSSCNVTISVRYFYTHSCSFIFNHSLSRVIHSVYSTSSIILTLPDTTFLNWFQIIQKGWLSKITLLDVGAQENANSWSETNVDVSTSVALGRLRSQVKQLSDIFMTDTY